MTDPPWLPEAPKTVRMLGMVDIECYE
jgi:hypothetical protein